jgi:hypothetical protein
VKAVGTLFALALASFSECSLPGPEFTWESERHWLRLDGERDTAEFFSFYAGLAPGEANALAALRAVVDGRPVFPPGGGFLSFDFDEDLDVDRSAEPDPKWLALAELAPTLSVEEAGLALDDAGRVGLWRRVRLERASEWLSYIESPVARGEGPHFPVGEFPAFDARSSELMEAAWARGERFWSIDGDSLRVDLPSTGANSARMFAHLFESALADAESDSRLWSRLAVSLHEVEIAGERMRARLGPDATGWMHVAWRSAAERAAGRPAAFEPRTLMSAGLEVEPHASFASRLPGAAR